MKIVCAQAADKCWILLIKVLIFVLIAVLITLEREINMSAYSTMSITREDAEYELRKRGLSVPISDDDVESKLFHVVGDQTLYNFRIVYEYQEQDEWGYPLQYYKGQFDPFETPKEMREEGSTYNYCPHCGEKL